MEVHRLDHAYVRRLVRTKLSNVFTLTVQQDAISAAFKPTSNTTTGLAQYTVKTTTGIQLPVTGLVWEYQHLPHTGMYTAKQTITHTLLHQTLHTSYGQSLKLSAAQSEENSAEAKQGNYWSTSQYEPKFAPIIMQGILYYTMYPGSFKQSSRLGSS